MALRMIDRSIWVPVFFLWASGMIDRSHTLVRCSFWLMAGGLHLNLNSSPPRNINCIFYFTGKTKMLH